MIYLRRNSGAISSKTSACPRVCARATVLRVSAEASGPSPASTSATGSSRSAARLAKSSAMSTRCDKPSIHADSSSAKPLGPGGRHIREYRSSLIHPRVGIGFAEDVLSPRLAHTFEDADPPAMTGLVKRNPGPTGEHIGEARDVVLRVTSADAERVQLQNFAGEVFV